jgi:bifunctional non-homologous end joining protein LigD
MALPIETRRQRLEQLLGRTAGPLQLSPVFAVEPAELMQVARARGLEGIVAKKNGSFYEPGRRSGAWVKCKIVLEQEFVVGGFTPPQNSRQGFGAILVGYYESDSWLCEVPPVRLRICRWRPSRVSARA